MAIYVVWWCYDGMPYAIALMLLLVFTAICFGELLRSHGQLPFQQVAMTMVAGLLIPFLLAALVRIQMMDQGRFFVAAPFVMAFMTDTGAYLIGCAFGKHKLCPNISPKKSWEGFAGGIVIAAASLMLYGLLMAKIGGFRVNYALAAVYGLAGSLGSVFGDLSMSVIKRQTGIKDYGKLIPGHGGVLDRFDSLVMVAPLMEALILVLPVIIV